MKQFNTEGICCPERHYMVDIHAKVATIRTLIDNKKYFTINRPRQYGKTSMLAKLADVLQPQYYVISLSFQGVGAEVFADGRTFLSNFLSLGTKYMQMARFPKRLISAWDGPLFSVVSAVRNVGRKLTGKTSDTSFVELRERIVRFCASADKPVVLMIDEVDQASNCRVFLDFLGVLRENHLQNRHEASFQSVILAGVTDVQSLNANIRPDGERGLYSPWNIATDFNVDMSFSAEEIAGMLREYETDHQTGMNVPAVSREIRRLTSGYPYIVSWLCNWLDTNGSRDWTVSGVQKAGEAYRRSDSLLLENIQDMIENNKDLKELLIRLLFYGAKYAYKPRLPETDLGVVYGILTEGPDNRTVISNLLFEEYIGDYVIEIVRKKYLRDAEDKSEYVSDNSLNMVRLLDQFQALLHDDFRKEDYPLLEKDGRVDSRILAGL